VSTKRRTKESSPNDEFFDENDPSLFHIIMVGVDGRMKLIHFNCGGTSGVDVKNLDKGFHCQKCGMNTPYTKEGSQTGVFFTIMGEVYNREARKVSGNGN